MGQGLDLLGTLARVIPERPPPLPQTPIERVLVVKLSSIGDVVHALPVASALRRTYRSARITWAVEEWCAPLVEGHPAIDRVIRFPNMRSWSRDPGRLLAAIRQATRELRSEPYDVVLDLQGLLRSACLARMATTPLRIARSGQREGAHLVSYGVPLPPAPVHAVEEYLEVARFLGATTAPVTFDLPVRAVAMTRVADLLAEAGVREDVPLIVLSPSASRRWKTWPLERWAEVANRLADRGTIVIAGTGEQKRVHARLAARLQNPAIDLTGRTTLSELIALLARAALHIAQDSGSVHIAAALRTPVVALYGPTKPSRLGPYGQVDAVINHSDLCGLECPAYCLRRRRCLAAATPEEIVAKAGLLLALPERQANPLPAVATAGSREARHPGR